MMGTDDSGGQNVHTKEHLLTEAERRLVHAIVQRRQSARNVNELHAERSTSGQRLADQVTRRLGSWRFIIIQSCLLLTWITFNVIGWINHWDPYPFILLNLALSFQAAYSAPIIMMSQNRQAEKDRIAAEEDYHCNVRVELDVAAMHTRLDDLAGQQWETLIKLQREQLAMLDQIGTLTKEIHRLTSVVEQRTARESA